MDASLREGRPRVVSAADDPRVAPDLPGDGFGIRDTHGLHLLHLPQVVAHGFDLSRRVNALSGNSNKSNDYERMPGASYPAWATYSVYPPP